MALLLEQANLLSDDLLRAGVIETFAQESKVLERMDFLDVPGNAYKYNMEGTLPGIAFRGVNQAFTESAGVINPQVETLKISGGDLKVDSHIIRTRGIGVRTAHEAMKIKALSRTITDKFFKGNNETDPREPDGLNQRLIGTQKILAGAGGAALTQVMLDDLLAACPGANAIMVGTGGAQLLTQLLRGDTQISTGVDAFGKAVVTYAGIPIVNVGKDTADAEILAFDEDPGDATLDTTSIYAVRMGSADAETDLFGLQNPGGMLVKDLGEMESTPAYLTRLEWDLGWALASKDCAARLYGVLNAIA